MGSSTTVTPVVRDFSTDSPTRYDITLSWDDVSWATEVGCARQIQALKENRHDAFGFTGDGWQVHIEGACGELAFARVTNRSWDSSLGRFRGQGGDASSPFGDLQIRTRSKPWYDLLIRPDAEPDDIYVLVTGTAPTYRVHGAIRAGRGMRPEYLQTYAGRAEAYFVPQHALRSITPLILVPE